MMTFYPSCAYLSDGAEGLDINRMQQAADQLVGDHDFRNFCKMDVITVSNFRRVINYAKICQGGQWQWARGGVTTTTGGDE